MGFLRKVTNATTGVGMLQKVIDQKLEEVRQRQSQGLDTFTVSVSQTDIGVRNRLDVCLPIIISAIQDAGYQVLAATQPGWDYVSVITVKAPSKRTPEPDFTPNTSAPSNDDSVGGEVRAFRELRKWSTTSMLGDQFGPGFGLEEATAVVLQCTGGGAYLRLCGGSLSRRMFNDIKVGGVKLEEWDSVMGHSEAMFRRQGIKRHQSLELVESLGEAKRLMIDVAVHEGLYSDWLADDRLAARTYAMHTVIDTRLGQAGIKDLIEL